MIEEMLKIILEGEAQMVVFNDTSKNKTRTAYRMYQTSNNQNQLHAQFKENGKVYSFAKKSVEILSGEIEIIDKLKPIIAQACKAQEREPDKGTEKSFSNKVASVPDSVIVYKLEQPCWKCKKKTEILTYLIINDGTDDNLIYPWDKKRLNESKTEDDEKMHMEYPSIEFYPIIVIGDDIDIDNIIMQKYPERIQIRYSSAEKMKYPMNLCQHCKSKQGRFFIYERINQIIKDMEQLQIVETI